eukprot:TRINITY_DN11205_c0_g1_i1.p1 TRINITY_DN11205_c0_g1~~TRINITY_DN11205_c0_g1_i1.p1  ORF type:complete len:139 (+),score=39.67 TRINITY_DN11205_c0_g1_i1:56-472(+)
MRFAVVLLVAVLAADLVKASQQDAAEASCALGSESCMPASGSSVLQVGIKKDVGSEQDREEVGEKEDEGDAEEDEDEEEGALSAPEEHEDTSELQEGQGGQTTGRQVMATKWGRRRRRSSRRRRRSSRRSSRRRRRRR